MATLTVNGRIVTIDADGDMPLLWGLRDHLNLTGTKFGCGAGLCGACTVFHGGEAIRSCVTRLAEVVAPITTIEGVDDRARCPRAAIAERVRNAWVAEQVPQCGYCQSGMIMTATALLASVPEPTDDDIDEAMTNLCRCGTYVRIRRAIHRAARGA